MPVYLVRIIGTRDLVGIFVAPDVGALAMLIDECTDPGDCEYQRMRPGGLMWTSPAVPVPLAYNEDDEDDLVAEYRSLGRAHDDRSLVGFILPMDREKEVANHQPQLGGFVRHRPGSARPGPAT